MNQERLQNNKAVIEYYGYINQTKKLLEELKELEEEVEKLLVLEQAGETVPSELLHNLVQESADVVNCIEQAYIIRNIDLINLDYNQCWKMQRQITRIRDEKLISEV